MNKVTPEKENQHDGPSEKECWLGSEPQCVREVSGVFDPCHDFGEIHYKNEAKQGAASLLRCRFLCFASSLCHE